MNSTRFPTNFKDVSILAHFAEYKITEERAQPDLDIRRIIGHAGVLDEFKRFTNQGQVLSIDHSPKPVDANLMAKQNNTVEHADYTEEDDVAITAQLSPCCRPSANSSTIVTIVPCDELDEESCKNNSGTDSGEGESTIYFQKSLQRPASPSALDVEAQSHRYLDSACVSDSD